MVAIDRIMNHDLHPHHALKLVSTETPYKCDGCKEMGFHSCYTCEEESCSFHLHRGCAEPPPSLSHPFFKRRGFLFLKSGGVPHRVCDACGMDVKGYVYRCYERDLDLHPCCANLERFIEDGKLKLELKRKMPSNCYRCGVKKLQGVSTWCYVSTDNAYSLHISCVKELVVKSWMTRKSSGDGPASLERTPMLQLVVGGGSNKSAASGKLAKIKKTVQMAITFIIAAVLGDPTALVAGLIVNLISQ